MLSSGEETLEGIMQKIGSKPNAGQKARLVDISADAEKGLGLFECLHDFDSAKNLSNHLKEATKKAYGEVGIAWLEYLAVNSSSVCQELREGIDHFKTLHDEDALESQALRVRDRFAICAAAGEIASKQGFTNWPEGTAFKGLDNCFKSWLSDRGSPKNLEDQNFLTQVRTFFTLHGESRFTDIDSTSDKDTSNRVGFRQNINANSGFQDSKELKEPVMEYYVLPEGFKEIIAGFPQKRAKALLVKKGWLT